MKKILVLISLILLFVLVFTNTKQRELSKNAFISAIGIDKGSKKKYHISLQIINPAGFAKEGTQKLPFFTVESEGDSFIEAYTNSSRGISRYANYSQVQLIIISEEIAKRDGMKQTMEYIFRPSLFPYNVLLIFTKKNNSTDFIKTLSLIEPLTSTEIKNLSTNLEENWGIVSEVTPVEFKTEVKEKGKEAILPVIELQGNIEKGTQKSSLEGSELKSKLKFNGMEFFKGYKPSGWLNDESSRIYSLLENKMDISSFNGKCPKGSKFSFRVYKSHTKIKGDVIKGSPHFLIKSKLKGNLANYLCDDDLSNPATGNKLEKILEKEITKNIRQLLNTSIKNKSDFIGLGEILKINNYSKWKLIEKDWYHLIDKSKFDIHVDVKLENYGDIT